MSIKAVLPHHLVEELQEYIQAGYIYIPAREDRQRPGVSKAAAAGAGGAERRNRGCLPAGGIPGGAGDKYFLSVHAIRKIVYQK